MSEEDNGKIWWVKSLPFVGLAHEIKAKGLDKAKLPLVDDWLVKAKNHLVEMGCGAHLETPLAQMLLTAVLTQDKDKEKEELMKKDAKGHNFLLQSCGGTPLQLITNCKDLHGMWDVLNMQCKQGNCKVADVDAEGAVLLLHFGK